MRVVKSNRADSVMRSPTVQAWLPVAGGLLSLAWMGLSALGQCVPSWSPGPGNFPPGQGGGIAGVAGEVFAVTQWDRDGSGPQAPVVAIAGNLLQADQSRALTLAIWDGSSLTPIGPGPAQTSSPCAPGGLCNVSSINALTVYQGRLIVAGQFTIGGTTDALNVAAWNGSAWEGLGTGLEPDVSAGLPFRTLALTVWNDTLIASATDAAYKLTNGTWTLLGPVNTSRFATDLISFQGELFRSGALSGINEPVQQAIERWNGTAWEGAWDQVQGARGTDLFAWNGELYMSVTDTPPGPRPFGARVMRWLGGRDWEQVGSTTFFGEVANIGALGSDLYVVGPFFGGDTGLQARGAARLTPGGEWQGFGSSLPGTVEPGVTLSPRVLLEYQGKLLVGGGLTFAGSTPVQNIGTWDGTSWAPLINRGSIGGGITTLIANTDAIFALGNFATLEGVPATNVAKYQNGAWSQLGGGFPRGGIDLARFGTSVALGTSGGAFAQVWALDGDAWIQLGQDLFAGGFITTAYVEELSSGLHAGILNSSEPAYRWNAQTGTWDVALFAQSPLASVFDLVEFDGSIIAGGNGFFEVPATTSSSCVVRVRPDGSIELLGENELGQPILRGAVRDLAVYQGQLYAVGSSMSIDEGNGPVPLNNIARWNGTTWTDVGGGLTSSPRTAFVTQMEVFQGELVVSGFFDLAGTTPARNVARWNGTQWLALDAGVGSGIFIPAGPIEGVSTLEVVNDTLFVGGAFYSVAGQPSSFIARWGCSTGSACDSIDFNNDAIEQDPTDLEAFFNVYSGGPCIPSTATCNDIDFNNDGIEQDPTDLEAFFSVYSGGPCL